MYICRVWEGCTWCICRVCTMVGYLPGVYTLLCLPRYTRYTLLLLYMLSAVGTDVWLRMEEALGSNLGIITEREAQRASQPPKV